jgi:sulfatase modifying factor 1
VNKVTFWDATRFANWLHNGQPTGAQDDTTTEGGAYDMSLPGTSVVREAGARVFVPSQDEWYKAAYYKGGGTSAGYWAYPAGSDTPTTCASPVGGANSANCDSVEGDLTDGGSYTGSGSPSGTFDQGGNVFEWNETLIFGWARGARGGFLDGPATIFAASAQSIADPDSGSTKGGFRVASVPGVAVPSLSPVGIGSLVGLLGALIFRRQRAASSSTA